MNIYDIIATTRRSVANRVQFDPADPLFLSPEQAAKELANLKTWADQLQADANRWTTKRTTKR